MLDGGIMKERDGVPYGLSREQMAPRDLSDFCVLTVHPRGTLVKLPRTGPVMLSGDLYHFPEELTLGPAPRGRNAEQIAASMTKMQEWLTRTGAQLWIQHDVLGYAKLKKSPAYYD